KKRPEQPHQRRWSWALISTTEPADELRPEVRRATKQRRPAPEAAGPARNGHRLFAPKPPQDVILALSVLEKWTRRDPPGGSKTHAGQLDHHRSRRAGRGLPRQPFRQRPRLRPGR